MSNHSWSRSLSCNPLSNWGQSQTKLNGIGSGLTNGRFTLRERKGAGLEI
jgi:hypothetical protein